MIQIVRTISLKVLYYTKVGPNVRCRIENISETIPRLDEFFKKNRIQYYIFFKSFCLYKESALQIDSMNA